MCVAVIYVCALCRRTCRVTAVNKDIQTHQHSALNKHINTALSTNTSTHHDMCVAAMFLFHVCCSHVCVAVICALQVCVWCFINVPAATRASALCTSTCNCKRFSKVSSVVIFDGLLSSKLLSAEQAAFCRISRRAWHCGHAREIDKYSFKSLL